MGQFDRVLLLELNEISLDLIKRQISKGKLPQFSKILDTWQVAGTTSESAYSNIEP